MPINSVMNLSMFCGVPWDVLSLGVAVTVRAEKAKAANNEYFFMLYRKLFRCDLLEA